MTKDEWHAELRTRADVALGEWFYRGISGKAVQNSDTGEWMLSFGPDMYGAVPLPPYVGLLERALGAGFGSGLWERALGELITASMPEKKDK